MPAAPPTSAMTVSRVALLGIIHLTIAKEVKENTNVNTAAQRIEGYINGNQNQRILPRRLFPAGNRRNCSSILGSILEITGSTKRITKAMLNQACANNNETR